MGKTERTVKIRELFRGSLPGKKSVPVPGSPMQDSLEVPRSEPGQEVNFTVLQKKEYT